MTTNDLQEALKDPRTGKAVTAALSRGNHIEVHPSKDGLKVYEVGKRLVATIKTKQ